ncbi:MAG TPA: BREX-3 system P-loop-containing protein BrxF [Euryarchaeota archaeon]|nr:BREX-3 system P-loop-containing protein BrxF [Euryarchaeota archaeon]
MNIQELIHDNKTNHYKLLTIVGDDPSKVDQLIDYLKSKDWSVYDVEEIVLDLIKDVPEDEVKLSIGLLIKRWLKNAGNRIVLTNAEILYSDEMDQIGPFDAFKYHMRGEKEGILFLNARLKENMAIYSKPDRPDYSERELTDVLYVALEDVTIQEE